MENLSVTDIGAWSTPLLAAVALNFVGLGLSKAEFFNNKYIPITLAILGGIIYPFIGTKVATDQIKLGNLIVQGMTCGGFAVLLNQQFKQFFKNE